MCNKRKKIGKCERQREQYGLIFPLALAKHNVNSIKAHTSTCRLCFRWFNYRDKSGKSYESDCGEPALPGYRHESCDISGVIYARARYTGNIEWYFTIFTCWVRTRATQAVATRFRRRRSNNIILILLWSEIKSLSNREIFFFLNAKSTTRVNRLETTALRLSLQNCHRLTPEKSIKQTPPISFEVDDAKKCFRAYYIFFNFL